MLVLYGMVGKHKEAYLFQKRHLAYRDSILSRDNANRLADIEVQIALQKTQQAIKLKDEENKNQRLWLGSLIGTLLAVVFLLLILYRNYRTQQKNNKKLAEQKQEIENQADTLGKVNHTKDTLFAIIGHDLRSPLNSLKGLMSLLENDNISSEEFILLSSKLKNGVEHVHFTLNNLLLWANSQMQGLETRPTHTNLTTLVKENFNLFGEIAKNKKIDLQHNLPTEMHAWADADQINLVLRNLISNALKFTPKGGEVKVRAMQKEQQIEIHLQDSGVGMSAETLSNLFRQDKHVSTYGTQGEKGTGLGLLLCQEMITKNGGKIWVESELGVGTAFKFVLPTS
jgi:signal transduction histidine kinase